MNSKKTGGEKTPRKRKCRRKKITEGVILQVIKHIKSGAEIKALWESENIINEQQFYEEFYYNKNFRHSIILLETCGEDGKAKYNPQTVSRVIEILEITGRPSDVYPAIISKSAYHRWYREKPDFRARVDAAYDSYARRGVTPQIRALALNRLMDQIENGTTTKFTRTEENYIVDSEGRELLVGIRKTKNEAQYDPTIQLLEKVLPPSIEYLRVEAEKLGFALTVANPELLRQTLEDMDALEGETIESENLLPAGD